MYDNEAVEEIEVVEDIIELGDDENEDPRIPTADMRYAVVCEYGDGLYEYVDRLFPSLELAEEYLSNEFVYPEFYNYDLRLYKIIMEPVKK